LDSLAVFSVDQESVVSIKGVVRRGSSQTRVHTHRRSFQDPMAATAEVALLALLEGA
jgi:hypothetical protein